MLIALPNFEGSFTVTLFLPFEGSPSFAELHDDKSVEAFFEKYFHDALPLLDDLCETFRSNPTGHMVTVKTSPWHYKDSVLLLGDAAHGIVPFFGQGMNCGFEDCLVFDELLDELISEYSKENEPGDTSLDWARLFERLYRLRKENTDAIADMAVENFVEMRDKVADKQFLLHKAVEKVLERKFPGRYVSRYSLVTFSTVPYRLAFEVGIIDEEILSELCKNISQAEELDLQEAERLIDEKLKPLLAPYTRELSTVRSH